MSQIGGGYVEERKKRVESMLREIAEVELELLRLKHALAEFASKLEKGSPKSVRVFKGYVVDERLREFRKMEYGEMPEFISFDSPKGQDLLSDMEAGKTNKDWYPYDVYGGYFKLENGVLMSCPMNADGSRDNSPYEVEPFAAWDNDFNPNEIVQELETKP